MNDNERGSIGRFSFRNGTCDHNVFRSVVELNEYRLPDSFDSHDVIIDVGAHIGSFARACIDRGAGKVYCFEPNAENYLLARINLAEDIKAGRVEIFQVGIWRSDEKRAFLHHSGYFETRLADDSVEVNTGGGDLIHSTGQLVPVLPLDRVLDELAPRRPPKRIRLLKLDCEYSEWPILYASWYLWRVEAICGEYHEIDHKTMPMFAKVSGEHLCNPETLEKVLKLDKFKVEICPHENQKESEPKMGLFFAYKPGFSFKVKPAATA